MTKASKPFGLLLGVFMASLFATGCGGSSGGTGAETEATQDATSTVRGGSGDVIGCGPRKSNRVESNWTSRLFLQRCQVGYINWTLRNAVNSSAPQGENGNIALALTDSYSNHVKFCTSLEAMYDNKTGERGKHSWLLGSFGDSLTEWQLKTKLSELMYCPAFFKEDGGRSMAIDVTERSDQSCNGGDACKSDDRSPTIY